MALSKKSISMLRAVKQAILSQPELYDQASSPYQQTDCGTPVCIAGWATWIAVNGDAKEYRRQVSNSMGVELMEKHVGLTSTQALSLFQNWPSEKLDTPAWTKPGTKAAALDAAKHIELFIKHGGAWN